MMALRTARLERRWRSRVAWSASALAVALACAGPARAEPQSNASMTLGGAGVGPEGRFWEGGEFHLGVRGDVLFGRESTSDFGIGPYAELGTFAFDELQFGGGASALLPINVHFPLVASVGAYGRWSDVDDYGLEPGLSGVLFWGSRSFNFHANYVMAAGLLVGWRQSLGESNESILLVAAQLDLAFMGLPLVALVDLMRGPSAEAAPIEPEEPAED
jgi:hypothetical protein